jgi:hypothetical protein
MLKRGTLCAALLLLPAAAYAQSDGTTGDAVCTTLANSAAAGLAATIRADNSTIPQPQSVTSLSCLSNFFNGAGLNVVTNLLNPATLLQSVEGQICSAVQSAWQSAIGSVQCGLTVTGFNMGGFGGLGGGNFCPTLSFGGGGTPVGSMSLGTGSNGLYVTGTGVPPSGYTLPTTLNSLF